MRLYRLGIAFIGLTAAALVSSPGHAQLNSSGTGLATAGAQLQKNLRNTPSAGPDAQPPVLPGTKAVPEAALPTVSPIDLTPTDALFDAINRGDLQAARDAVNRGAELDGHNTLGLTPLELSVDLGRTNVSFMLLSMRSDTAAARTEARLGARSETHASAQREMPRSRPRIIAASSRGPAEEEPIEASPRYSSGGGAPIPAAGFLGFGEGRTIR